MPRPKSQKRNQNDALITEALNGIAQKRWKTPYAAAKALGVSYATIKRRVRGGQTVAESKENVQLLTFPEEKALVGWITRLTSTGHPATHAFIREMAEEIRKRRVDQINKEMELVFYPPIGTSWVPSFLKRHSQLGTTLSKIIEASRITAITKSAMRAFFNEYQSVLTEGEILPSNSYNIDETGIFQASELIIGFAIGDTQRSYVVVDKLQRKQYQATPGRQEWVTAIECICTDGTNIPPLIIFKGDNFVSSWIPKNAPTDWKFSCNSKGWTSNEHGIMWLQRCFDPATKEKANGRTRLLICDGHDSHISATFMRYCYDNNIAVFLLIPHSSHLIQPLDVGVFGPLKAAMKSQLNTIFRTGIARLQKAEWIEKYVKAREKAMTQQNIEAGWRGAGLWPINPVRILRQIFEIEEEYATPPPRSDSPQLLTSSPPDGTILRSVTASLNAKIAVSNLPTPSKSQLRRLSRIAEQQNAQIAILQRENSEIRAVLGSRKERESGKRKILKGRRIVTTEEVVKALEVAEMSTKEKRGKKRTWTPSDESELSDVETDHNDEDDVLELPERPILDCIIVECR
jgi:hypothetical protein